MKLTEAQYHQIALHFPVQRGNVSISNLDVFNAILYGTGTLKNSDNNRSGNHAEDITPRFIWLPQMIG